MVPVERPIIYIGRSFKSVSITGHPKRHQALAQLLSPGKPSCRSRHVLHRREKADGTARHRCSGHALLASAQRAFIQIPVRPFTKKAETPMPGTNRASATHRRMVLIGDSSRIPSLALPSPTQQPAVSRSRRSLPATYSSDGPSIGPSANVMYCLMLG